MELNQAFATHWDKMNPSAHKQACDHSRQLFEDAEKKRKNKEKEKEKEKVPNTVSSTVFSSKPI